MESSNDIQKILSNNLVCLRDKVFINKYGCTKKTTLVEKIPIKKKLHCMSIIVNLVSERSIDSNLFYIQNQINDMLPLWYKGIDKIFYCTYSQLMLNPNTFGPSLYVYVYYKPKSI